MRQVGTFKVTGGTLLFKEMTPEHVQKILGILAGDGESADVPEIQELLSPAYLIQWLARQGIDVVEITGELNPDTVPFSEWLAAWTEFKKVNVGFFTLFSGLIGALGIPQGGLLGMLNGLAATPPAPVE